MSGPNTNYDPVEVAALDPQVIDDAVQAALDAAAGATTLSRVCASTGAGRDCGACVFSVRRILCESVGSEVDTGLFPSPAEVDRAAS